MALLMQNNESNTKADTPPRNWRRAKVTASVLLAMVFSGFAITPTVIMNSAYRDQILNNALKEKGLTATTESGSGSWLTSMQLTGLHITDATRSVDVRIQSITTDQSLLSLMMKPKNLGQVTVENPVIRLALDENGELPKSLRQNKTEDDQLEDESKEKERPNIGFDIRNAAMSVTVPWREIPIVEADQLGIRGAVATNDDGERWLDLDAVQVFDYETLSDLHTEQNLALIAPILSKTTKLDGEFSLRIDPIHHQLNSNNDTPIDLTGYATLHSVRANLTQDWAQQLGQMVGQSGSQSGAGGLEVVRDSRVDFEVIEEGIYHEGFAFVLPQTLGQTQIASSGVVGFDESVDLDFRVQLQTSGFGGALMSGLSRMLSGPLVMKVTGTISDPQLAPPPGFGIADQLSENIRPGSSAQPAPPIKDTVMDLIGTSAQGSADPAGDITGGILNMIRAARDAKQQAAANADRVLEEPGPSELTPRQRRELRRQQRRNPGI